jgi:hypothetical protein
MRGRMRIVVGLVACAVAGILGLAGVVGFQIWTRRSLPVRNPRVQLISTGKRVDIGAHVQEHGYTIIEFVCATAPGSRNIARRLDAICQRDPGVRVRVIDIGTRDSEVARQFDVEQLPMLWLYRDGTLVTTDSEAVWKRLEPQ